MPFDSEITTKEDIKAQLERAKTVVRERGHMKGGYLGARGEVCTWAAIEYGVRGAATCGAPCYPAHEAVAAEIKRTGGVVTMPTYRDDPAYIVCNWNNGPQIHADDVIALFERTIASL